MKDKNKFLLISTICEIVLSASVLWYSFYDPTFSAYTVPSIVKLIVLATHGILQIAIGILMVYVISLDRGKEYENESNHPNK